MLFQFATIYSNDKFLSYYITYSASNMNRNSSDTSTNDADVTTTSTNENNRNGSVYVSPRNSHFLNPITFRLARLHRGGPWYCSNSPRRIANAASSAIDETRADTIEQQPQAAQPPRPPPPSISPDVIIYEPNPSIPGACTMPYSNPSTVRGSDGSGSVPNNNRDSSQAVSDGDIIDAHAGARNAQAQQSQTPAQVQQTSGQTQGRHGSRCPYFRRLSASGYHNVPNFYHPNIQNGSPYLRPAYAPHESLWYRQQNNQEIHRRHMMNSMSSNANASNDNPVSGSFSTLPYPRSTASGDQQHPIAHPHRRMARQYVCGLNLVR